MTVKTPLETAQDKIFGALDVRDATGQVPPRLEFTTEERDAIHDEWIRSLKATKTPLESAKYKIEEAKLKGVGKLVYTVELTPEEAQAWEDYKIATIIMMPKLKVPMD